MVRLSRFLCLVFLGVSLLLPAQRSVHAATPPQEVFTYSPALPLQQRASTDDVIETSVRLDELKIREEALTGPFDGRFLSIKLPANWRLQSGAALQLDMETLLSNAGTGTLSNTTSFLGGVLDVQFNNTPIGRIFLNRSGPRLVTLPISDTALISTRTDGAYSLSFVLDAGLNCGTDKQTSVLIRSSTTLILPHTLEPVVADLKTLPRPIIQDSPLEENSAVIIVPDKATSAELQAAFTVSAKVGSITSSNIQVPLLAESVVTPTLRNEVNLIYVGKPDSFADLGEVEFSQAPVSGSFSGAGAQTGDGVVAMAASPWNEARGVLLISGNDDAGVVKAAQAFSTGNVRSTGDPSISVIADIRAPEVATNTMGLQFSNVLSDGIALRRTLFDLGYKNRTEYGIGGHVFDFFVDMPSGYELRQDAAFDLLFTHSALLDYNVSALQIKINDEPVSSVQLSDATAENGSARVNIAQSSLKVGRNKISVTSNLIPTTPCVNPTLAGIWVNIRGESTLTLALKPIQSRSVVVRNLATFYEPMTISPTLKNIAFIVNNDDPDSWSDAGRIAFDLGDRLDPSIVELRTVFPDELDAVKDNHDLVVVGQPSKLAVLQDLNASLPAQFAPNSDHPTFGNSRVQYRITPDVKLGYVSISPSPWNSIRTVLTVLGNSAEAKQWATNALTTNRLRSRLNGTIAVVNQEQLTVEDSTLTASTSGLGTVLEQNQQATAESRVVPEQPRQTWILYAIGVMMVLMWIILGYMGWKVLRQRRAQRQQ